MFAAEVPAEVQNFWVPVSQIVPVFGLALILEARRLAKDWKIEAPWIRRTQSVVMFVASLILFQIWVYALSFMAKGQTDRLAVSLASLGLATVFAGLAYAPVISMLGIANADLGFRFLKSLPFTPFYKQRRGFERLRRELLEVSELALAQEEQIMSDLAKNAQRRRQVRESVRNARALAPLDLTDIQRDGMNRDVEECEKLLASLKASRKEKKADLARTRKLIVHANEVFKNVDQALTNLDPKVISEAELQGFQKLLDESKARL